MPYFLFLALVGSSSRVSSVAMANSGSSLLITMRNKNRIKIRITYKLSRVMCYRVLAVVTYSYTYVCVLTRLLAVLHASLVRRLLDVLVNISSTNQLLGSVPHRQACCRVVEEYAVISRPNHTPGNDWQSGKFKISEKDRRTCWVFF